VKPLLVAVVCVLAGLAVGAIWTLVQPDRYRADARVLVRPASSRVVPAIEALAESSLVEANVAQTLHLASPPDVSARSAEGGVLTVSAEGDSRERARQIDAEAVVILLQKIEQRFAATTSVRTTILDPAHTEEQTSPTPKPNLLLGAVAGLLVGLGCALGLRRGIAPPTTGADPSIERRLRARIDQVAKRERELAKRAGEVAAREKRLEQREGEVTAVGARREREFKQREDDLRRLEAEAAASVPVSPPAPAQTAARATMTPATPAPVNEARAGAAWTLAELEALVRERVAAGAEPARQEEWSTYLFFLREHAGADGGLPSGFDQLVNDVFGPLPSRLTE
jgi:hypothetical protein